MFRPARLFHSKNRRTPLQMTPRRLTGQSVEDQIRQLQSAWGDVLSLPLCLVALAFYEWWRWLFSIPSNPLLLTLVAAVAIRAAWRRRKVYKADLRLLRLGQASEPTVKQLVRHLRITGCYLLQRIKNTGVPLMILASVRRALSPASGLAKRLTARL